jgi:hypothetical protein
MYNESSVYAAFSSVGGLGGETASLVEELAFKDGVAHWAVWAFLLVSYI